MEIPRYTVFMTSYLDLLPNNERQKIKNRMRSPEAYEKLRDRVKGPEDLEREMERGERMAELHFALESEPEVRDRLREKIKEDIREQGIDAVLEHVPDDDIKQMIEAGTFDVAVDEHPETSDDVIMLIPEGNVQEKIPVKTSLQEQYAIGLISGIQ